MRLPGVAAVATMVAEGYIAESEEQMLRPVTVQPRDLMIHSQIVRTSDRASATIAHIPLHLTQETE